MTHRIGRPPHPDVLTPAEWRVLDQLREGHPNAEIAVRLGISVNTVRTHVSNMLAKLELPDRHALAAWDGQPKRRFGFVPAFPSIGPLALGVSFVRGSAIVGGVAAAAAIVAAILLVSSSSAEEARTSILVAQWTGLATDELQTSVFGIDPATGAPLADAESIDLDGRHMVVPFGAGTGLIRLFEFGGEEPIPGEPLVLTAHDGSPLGIASYEWVADEEGIARRWTLPGREEPSFVAVQPLEPDRQDGVIYGARTPATGDGELWSFDLETDRVEQLTTATQIGEVHQTLDGRLFVVVRDPGFDFSLTSVMDTESLGMTEADYLASANDYIAEIDPVDGHEIARIEFDRAITSTIWSPDHGRWYLFHGTDGDASAVDIDTMLAEPLALPTGGPWPGLWLFGPQVSPVLSTDGRSVYLTGTDFLPCGLDFEGRTDCLARATGLRIVHLETGEVRYEDPDVNHLRLSPDGRLLLTALSEQQVDGSRRGNGIKIVETSTLRVIAHLEPGSAFDQIAVSADGQYAYAVGDEIGLRVPPSDCPLSCAVITVIDLTRREVVAQHPYDGELFLAEAY